MNSIFFVFARGIRQGYQALINCNGGHIEKVIKQGSRDAAS